MQERFDKQNSIRAIRLFKSFLENLDLKEKISNSNKNLVLLTVIAYFKECTKTKLKRIIPITSLDISLDELIKAGYIKKTRDGREVTFTLVDSEDFTKAEFNYDFNVAYLFANTIMNIFLYIKKYEISSWNTIAFMLEIAMKSNFNKGGLVHLAEENIQSILGCSSNKTNLRKTLEKMGIIKGALIKKGRSYGGDFKVNKNAFIFTCK